MIKPKKFLGQHFLTDLTIAERIADTLSEFKALPVLEIGPGMGVLTQYLIQKGYDLTVIELDRDSVPYLKEHYPAISDRVIEGDFLKMNLDNFFKGEFCVIGNYPYNISSQIFFRVLDFKDRIPCCSGMIQKEVAERMASKPGTKSYGILSVLMQAYYDIEYLFTVPPSVFNPPPKVQSAVIRMTRNKVHKLDCNEILFKRIVKSAFNQRRKTMRNSLRGLVEKECPILSESIFDLRPERLSVKDFVSLTNLMEPYIGVSTQVSSEK